MKKALICLVFIVVMAMSSGCKTIDFILEGALADVEGWDFTACVSNLGVCFEFAEDNYDKFSEG